MYSFLLPIFHEMPHLSVLIKTPDLTQNKKLLKQTLEKLF